MITISKEKRRIYYEYEKVQTKPHNNEFSIPIPKTNYNAIISFDDWSAKFNNESENIIYQYFKLIMNSWTENGYKYSMKVEQIKKEVSQLIYNSSLSRYKYYQKLI